jgi:cytochrome d ubiquinol oxidase subunit I
MSTVDLARLQFAVTTSVHFLFVALTLGLVTLVAITQTRFAISGNPVLGRMTRFWGKLYVINYAVGIATGIVMEFQFGLNWSGLSRLTGDVFGAPLAMETLIAFVLESTFLGMWIFGWGRLPKRLHLALIWGVTLTAYLSAFWVMVSNSFLQHPVGYAMVDGRARLTSFAALIGNSSLWFALGHLLSATVLIGGFFMAGVSAAHLLRRTTDVEFFRRSLRTGLVAGFVGTALAINLGYSQLTAIGVNVPTKFATGDEMARWQSRFQGLYGVGDYAPPHWIHSTFDTMVQLANVLALIAALGLVFQIRNVITAKRWARWMLWVLVATIPVPFVTAIGGWMVREVGRQPWTVYGVLKTSDAVSPLPASTLQASLIGFGVLVIGLAVLDWYLIAKHARRGPGDEFLPVEPETRAVAAFPVAVPS